MRYIVNVFLHSVLYPALLQDDAAEANHITGYGVCGE